MSRGWSSEDAGRMLMVLVGLWAVAIWADCVSGCGGAPSTTRLHASAAVAMRTVLDGTADTIEMERERAQLEAVQEARDEATARAHVARVREDWALVVEGHAIAVAAWQTWVHALVLADSSSEPEALAQLSRALASLVRAYARTRELVIDAGGPRLPELPDMVAALVGEL